MYLLLILLLLLVCTFTHKFESYQNTCNIPRGVHDRYFYKKQSTPQEHAKCSQKATELCKKSIYPVKSQEFTCRTLPKQQFKTLDTKCWQDKYNCCLTRLKPT